MGLYIALEGGEGSGKSSQAKRLARRIDAVLTREPGGTGLGAELRQLLLSPDLPEISARAEALLMAADRAEHMELVVEPALAAGRHVVADRSVYSSLAYQGGARGLGVDAVMAINQFGLKGRLPDKVVLLEADAEVARSRMTSLPDRLEAAGQRFHAAVARTYAELASAEPDRFLVVSANDAFAVVESKIWAAIEPWIAAESIDGNNH
ncbi:MAG: dTMP kinase [Acidimicrobiales bacterium]|nr:dTMP kinase [Acidimicrobiales bacterium]